MYTYIYIYISNNFFSSISQLSTISQRSSTFHVVRFSFFFGNQRACVHALSFLHPIHSCLSYNAISVDPIPGPAEVWVGHAKGQSSPCIPHYSATSTTLIIPTLHPLFLFTIALIRPTSFVYPKNWAQTRKQHPSHKCVREV